MGIVCRLLIVSCVYKFSPHVDQCEVRGRDLLLTSKCSRCKVSKFFLEGSLRFTSRLERSIMDKTNHNTVRVVTKTSPASNITLHKSQKCFYK